jgi:exonuclease SbcC
MISAISLKNWKTHRDTTVEFGRGTNLIIGIMGSGKSALLDALSYSLFGTFPQVRRREASTEDSITFGETGASLSLDFVHGGKKYRVERRLKREGGKTGTASKLFREGKLLESGSKRVNGMVSSILEIDYDLFTRAIYSEQNNIDYFLTIDPAKRKREMDRLLGLDRFESARASCVSLLNRISHEADSLSSLFSAKEHESLLLQKREKSSLLQSLSEKSQFLQKERQRLESSRASLKKRLGELESLSKKRDSLKSAMERALAKREVLSSELEGKSPSESSLQKKREALGELSEKRKLADSRISTLEKSISAASRLLGKNSSMLSDAKSSLKKLRECESGLASLSREGEASPESLLEKTDSAILSASSKIDSLSSKIAELKESMGSLKEGATECPVCDSPLQGDAAERIRSQKKEAASLAESELSNLKASLPALKSRRQELQKKIQKKSSLSSSIPELRERTRSIPSLEKERLRMEAELTSLSKEKESILPAMEKRAREYSDLLLSFREEESLLKKAALLKDAQSEAKRSREELSALKLDDSELERVRSGHSKAEILFERASSSLASLQKERASATEMLKILQERIAQMEKAKAESGYLQKLKSELQIYRNSLLELQSELRAELTGAISSAMNNIWPILYPYADYKQLRIIATEKDYFFEVNDGEWRRLEKIASGGEKACLSLTLRMALATVLTPSVGWMMLDEPTHNLDAEAIHTLSEALENKVPEIIPQSIVITHEENLISSEFARSYKFSRDKESLGPTVVESL